MADEKILEGEVLDDADLENVAGGTGNEILDDAQRLHKKGKFNWKGTSFYIDDMAAVLKGLGKQVGMNIQYKWSQKNGVANEYKINGEKFTREQFWSVVDSLYPNKK